jgi:hypothetical protein
MLDPTKTVALFTVLASDATARDIKTAQVSDWEGYQGIKILVKKRWYMDETPREGGRKGRGRSQNGRVSNIIRTSDLSYFLSFRFRTTLQPSCRQQQQLQSGYLPANALFLHSTLLLLLSLSTALSRSPYFNYPPTSVYCYCCPPHLSEEIWNLPSLACTSAQMHTVAGLATSHYLPCSTRSPLPSHAGQEPGAERHEGQAGPGLRTRTSLTNSKTTIREGGRGMRKIEVDIFMESVKM